MLKNGSRIAANFVALNARRRGLDVGPVHVGAVNVTHTCFIKISEFHY